MTKYDPRYKITFSNRWLVQQFVQAFLHESVTDVIDFEAFEMYPTESISEDSKSKEFKNRLNDVMWKFKLNDGSQAYVLLMVEAQSDIDSKMAVRICEYVINWYRHLMVAEGLEALPLIVPMVLYNGDKGLERCDEAGRNDSGAGGVSRPGHCDGGRLPSWLTRKGGMNPVSLPKGNIFEPLIKALHTSAQGEFRDSFDMDESDA